MGPVSWTDRHGSRPMKAFSMDLRERVLTDCEAGMTTSAVAQKYSVSPAWVRRFKQRYKAKQQIGPTPQARRGVTPGWVTSAEQIKTAVAATPDATLAEYREKYKIPLSKSALARALIVLGMSRKKSRSGPVSRIAPTSKPNATNGKPARPTSTRRGSSSSTKPGPAPT